MAEFPTPISTEVTIEPCLESSVYEYTVEGDKIKSTQSMSDHFTKILSRMDLNDETSETNSIDEEKKNANGKNPFTIIFDEMRKAQIEVCALHDILSLVLTQRYFNLFNNVPEAEDNSRLQRELLVRESQDIIQKSWISKRQSAKQAADVLLSSYLRFTKIGNTSAGNPENFHADLSNLRQRWKIHKHANTNRYLGDLSFRSTGLSYPLKSQFEVTKADGHNRTQQHSIEVSKADGHNRTQQHAIEVIIPEDLQVRMVLRIDIETNGQILLRTYSTMLANDTLTNSTENNFDILLENAQRTIFLKELFSQLCREASEITNTIQPIVMRNSIKCWILSDVVMTISLYRANEFESQMETDGSFSQGSHVGLLEYSLCALLRQQYLRYFRYSTLKPSTLMLGVPPARRIAGINAFNYQQLQATTDNKSILQTIVELAQHQIIRSRILDLFDQIANQSDVNMIVNVSAFSSMTSTYGRIQLIPPGYDALGRWSYMFQIEECQVHIQYKSHCIEFHHHLDELQRFFLHQIAHFKFSIACNIAKIFGWTLIGSTMAPTVGRLTEIQFSGQFDHPNLLTSVAVRIGDDLQLQVAVRRRRQRSNSMEDETTNDRSLGIKFESVNLDDFCGTTNLQKFDMFIANLLHEEKQQ